jgi:peroxiredoxin
VADEDKSVSGSYGTLNALRRASTRQTFGIGADGKIIYHNADVKPREMAGYRAIQDAFGIKPEGD